MKIIKFSVNGFRGINGGLENNSINFENSNTIFIFGQNNIGKSSFLAAYNNFYLNSKPDVEDFYMQKSESEIVYELDVELDQYDKQRMEAVSKKTDFLFNNYVKDSRLKLQKIWKMEDGGKGKKQSIESSNKTFDPNKKNWDEKDYGGIGLHEVFRECLPQPILIKAMPSEPEVEATVEQVLAIKARESLESKDNKILEEAIAVIEKVKDKMFDPARIETYRAKVNEQFKKLFPDTAIKFEPQSGKNNLTLAALTKKFEVKFDRLNENGSVNPEVPSSYDKIGHGAIRTALFTLFLMKDVAEGFERKEGKKNYLVLFEEPELFLHPKLLKTLRGLIYQVSENDMPYQMLCASHSAQMIDITKPKSSLVRMAKKDGKSSLFQVDELLLMEAKDTVRQELHEVLRFNPYICESFYADEVILVEGDSEAIILRAFLQTATTTKDIFVLNCGTVNNIPFFQKIFSRFNIKYHVFCDTDGRFNGKFDQNKQPIFEKFIQGKIYEQINEDVKKTGYQVGILRVHDKNFEEAHRLISSNLKYPFSDDEIKQDGKPFCANRYWDDVLKPNLGQPKIDDVPIIKYFKEMLAH